MVLTEGDAAGSSTPAGEPEDDFFSSWDKPAIKKPTPPVSRTATPPVVGRTPSPFLNPGTNGKDIARASSPLAKSESADAKPTASRITHSAALKKTATGPKKASVLGAKKTQKLGVKKVTGDIIDFDEAEKKAKEEAERIEKLGYDPNAEEEAAAKKPGKTDTSAGIISPTPVSPVRGGYGNASHSREKSASEMERLGMGMGRLGFGQVGGSKPAPQKKGTGGFGSVGPIKAAAEGTAVLGFFFFRCELATDWVQTTTRNTPDPSLARKRPSPQTSSSAREPLTPTPKPRPRRGYRASKGPRPSPPTPTLAGRRRRRTRRITGISSRPRRTSSASLGSRPATIWRTCHRSWERAPHACRGPSAVTWEAEPADSLVTGRMLMMSLLSGSWGNGLSCLLSLTV